MSLPKIHTAHETVDVAGALFDLRVITRAEAARFHRLQQDRPDDRDQLEMEVIAAATDTPLDEVREWYASTPGWAVEELLAHIKRMSRLDAEEAQKSGGESDRSGGG